MIKSFINQLAGKAQEKLKARSRRTHLAVETLESRDVPSAAPDASDLAPVVTVAPILNTEGSANTWILSSPIAGNHTITSPNGLSTVTIINETNGGVPASPGSSSSTQVFENGVLVWQQSSALVGEALFSPDSQHLALVVDTSSGWEVIEDGNLVGSGYSSVSLLTFSQDGNDLAFITYGPGAGKSAGYKVVENGIVVSSTYYAIGDLQFNSPGDQLSFTGYQSQSVPAGILPQFIEFNYVPLTSAGEWGYVVSYDGPTISTPTDPVTVDVPSGAAPKVPVIIPVASTPTNPVQNPSQPSSTAPVSNSTPSKITPTNTVTVSKTTDPPKTVTTSKTTLSTSGSHKTASSGATEVDSKVSQDTLKGNDLVLVTPSSPPASKVDENGTSKSNSSSGSGGSTMDSSNHELGVVVPLFDHTEAYLSPVLVDASYTSNKDDEED